MAQGQQISNAYGFNGYVQVFPLPIVTTRDPVNGGDSALNGQIWINTAADDAFVCVNQSTSTWIGIGGGAGVFTALTVNPGPTSITGQLTTIAGGQNTNIATDAAANAVTIGSTNTTSATTIQSGTGGGLVTSTGLNTISSSRANNAAIAITASNAAGGITLSAANATITQQYFSTGATTTLDDLPWALATGMGEIDISNDATNTTVNVGTGAGVKTVVVGSTNATSATTITSGTGNIALTATGTAASINATVNATGAFNITGSDLAFGTAAKGVIFQAGPKIIAGSVDPNGSVNGTDGSIYLRTGTATASTVLYVCTGGTTWTAVTVP